MELFSIIFQLQNTKKLFDEVVARLGCNIMMKIHIFQSTVIEASISVTRNINILAVQQNTSS